ncbi:MAG TPA: SRPBCC family protein, partial [Solirubrobacterales bacterium]|nr:SRPBCC family protein [Solirubrobacterales bacterium]
YETFPSWQSAVIDTEVLDWDGEGRGKRVRLFIDAKVRKVDYTLDYRYDPPERIEWDFVEGNGINGADGHYLFEDLGGRTRATYRLGLGIAIPLPGPIARRAHRSTLKGSVEDLKREAERRAAGIGERARAGRAAPSSGARPAPAARSDRSRSAPASGSASASSRDPLSEEYRPVAGPQSIGEMPALLVERAVSTGRRVSGESLRATRDVAEGVAGAGFGLARRALHTGAGVAGAVTSRAGRLVGRRSKETEEYERR